jgi:hypothetical protein
LECGVGFEPTNTEVAAQCITRLCHPHIIFCKSDAGWTRTTGFRRRVIQETLSTQDSNLLPPKQHHNRLVAERLELSSLEHYLYSKTSLALCAALFVFVPHRTTDFATHKKLKVWVFHPLTGFANTAQLSSHLSRLVTAPLRAKVPPDYWIDVLTIRDSGIYPHSIIGGTDLTHR